MLPNLPHMDDRVILHLPPIIEPLLPHDVAVLGGEGADDVQQFLDVDRLQLVIVPSYVPLPHEGRDVGVALPEIVRSGQVRSGQVRSG